MKKAMQSENIEIKTNQFEIKDIYVIIFFAVITFLFFRELILQQKFLWADFVPYYYPVRNFAAVTLSNGIFPHWNPYILGGMPFLADIQTAIFYPLHLLLTIFVTEDKLPFVALEYILIFHYFMAGVFSYYLARSFNLNKWASILCGITFMFCGFMVANMIFESYVNSFTYMPIIFMFYNKSLSTSKPKYILLTGLFIGIVILCSHPQIVLYILFTFLLFGLCQIFFKFKENNYKINASLLKFIAIATIPFIIGVMLGAIQLLPTMRLTELSVRANMSYKDSLEGQLNYHNLLTLFSPKIFGYGDAAQDPGVRYWGHKEGGSFLYVCSCIYVGLSALFFGLLGIITLWKKRIIKFLAIVSLLSILFILGDNFILYKFFYNFVPGFDKFRYIGRFGLVLAFSFSLLCAYGFDYFINNAKSEKVKIFIKYSIILILISSFILLSLSQITRLFEELIMHKYEGMYKDKIIIAIRIMYKNSISQLMITVIILSTLIGLVIFYKKKIIPPQVILPLFILLSFTDLYIFGSQQNNSSVYPEEYYLNQEMVTKLKQEYTKELFRIKLKSKIIQQKFVVENQELLDYVFTLDGNIPLTIQNRSTLFRTDELMNVKYIVVFDTVTEQFKLEYNENYLPRAWMSYYPIVENSLENVAKILEDTTFDIIKKVIVDQEPEIHINKALMGGGTARNQIMIKSYEINEITILAGTTENGILVLSEVYYPNWKVFVDGVEKPMLRCDYSLRGVAIEKGNHTVVFKYVDKDFQLGATITLFALAIVMGGFIVARKL